jgi:hypothetical protein
MARRTRRRVLDCKRKTTNNKLSQSNTLTHSLWLPSSSISSNGRSKTAPENCSRTRPSSCSQIHSATTDGRSPSEPSLKLPVSKHTIQLLIINVTQHWPWLDDISRLSRRLLGRRSRYRTPNVQNVDQAMRELYCYRMSHNLGLSLSLSLTPATKKKLTLTTNSSEPHSREALMGSTRTSRAVTHSTLVSKVEEAKPSTSNSTNYS